MIMFPYHSYAPVPFLRYSYVIPTLSLHHSSTTPYTIPRYFSPILFAYHYTGRYTGYNFNTSHCTLHIAHFLAPISHSTPFTSHIILHTLHFTHYTSRTLLRASYFAHPTSRTQLHTIHFTHYTSRTLLHTLHVTIPLHALHSTILLRALHLTRPTSQPHYTPLHISHLAHPTSHLASYMRRVMCEVRCVNYNA